jgi:hypothetical protein
MITPKQFIALYPLYSLVRQMVEADNIDFDITMSRDDFMNGKNGIEPDIGVICVWELLTMPSNYVHISPDGQHFAIKPDGMRAIHKYHDATKGQQN